MLKALHRLTSPPWTSSNREQELDFQEGERLLREHTEALLGQAEPEWSVRIMVTMPSEASEDYLLVHDLVQQGMDCMRIGSRLEGDCGDSSAACPAIKAPCVRRSC